MSGSAYRWCYCRVIMKHGAPELTGYVKRLDDERCAVATGDVIMVMQREWVAKVWQFIRRADATECEWLERAERELLSERNKAKHV